MSARLPDDGVGKTVRGLADRIKRLEMRGNSGGVSGTSPGTVTVVNNASQNATSGNIVITNSLTPTFSSATIANSSPALTLSDGTYSAQIGLASGTGSYHTLAVAGDAVVRGNSAGSSALLVANASSSGYVKVSNAAVSIGGPVTTNSSIASGGNITENGTRVLTNVTVANNASVAVAGGTAAITNSLTPTFTTATATSQLVAKSATASTGYVTLNPGNASGTGFIEFFGPNAARQGYIGFDTSSSTTDNGTIQFVANTFFLRGVTQFNAGANTNGPISVGWNSATADNNSYGIAGITAPTTGTATFIHQAYYSMTASGNSVYGIGISSNNAGSSMRLGSIGVGKLMSTTAASIDSDGNAVIYNNLQMYQNKQVYYSTIGQTVGIVGTDVRYDTITGGAGALSGNLAAQTVDAYNIKDGAIIASKLSLPAIASVIASGAGNNTSNSFFRFAYALGSDGLTCSYVDPASGVQLSGLQPQNGASLVTDPQAYQNYAVKIPSTVASGTQGLGYPTPSLGAIALPIGIYNITFFVRVSANTSSSTAATFTFSGSGGSVCTATGTPALIANTVSTTGYMGYSVAVTISGAPATDFRAGVVSGGLVDVFVSHITGIPVAAVFNPYVSTVFTPNIFATSATISSVSATSLTAGFINSDDIFLGSGGHLYAGNKTGGRVELNAAGIQAYQTVNLLPVTGSSFEDGTTGGWSGAGVALSNDTIGAVDGTKGLKLLPNTAGVDSYAARQVTTGFTVGQVLVFSGTVYNPAAQTGSIDTRARGVVAYFFDASSALLGGSTLFSYSASANTNNSTRVYTSFTVPASTTRIELRLYNGASNVGANGNGNAVWWDGIQLEAGTYPTVFTTNVSASATTMALNSNGILTLTNPTGSKIIMDPHAGLQFYATDGVTKTVDLDITTGNAAFTGQVKATSGYIGTGGTSGWAFDANVITGGSNGTANSLRLVNGAGGGPYLQVFGNATNSYVLLDGRSGSGRTMQVLSAGTETFYIDKSGSVALTGTLSTLGSTGVATGARMVMSQAGAYGSLNMYTGDANEGVAGVLYNTVFGSGNGRQLITTLASAKGVGGLAGYALGSQITLSSSSINDTSQPATIALYGNQINFSGPGGASGNEIGVFGYLSMVGYPTRYNDAAGVPRGYMGTCTSAGGYLTDNAVGDLFIRSENAIIRFGGVATDSTLKVDATNTTSNNVAIKGRWFANGVAGSTGVTTDAAGSFTITHNLNNSSHVTTMVTNTGTNYYWQLTARGANTSTFTLRNMSTAAAVASTAITFFWMATIY